MLLAVISLAVWLTLWIGVTYWCLAARASDPVTLYFKVAFGVIAAGVALDSVPAFHLSPAPITAGDVVTSCAIVVTAIVAWRRRRARRKEPLPPKAALPWGVYLYSVLFAAVAHYALADLYAQLAHGEVLRAAHDSPAVADGLVAHVTIFVMFFALSQISTRVIQRGFASSLRRDWRVLEGSPHRRAALFALGAAPMALCVVPSLMTSALLFGVLARLLNLTGAWWLTRDAPQDRDAEFLSWSMYKTARTLRRRTRPRRQPWPARWLMSNRRWPSLDSRAPGNLLQARMAVPRSQTE